MSKISNKISSGLSNAITEAQEKMNNNSSVEELLNSGVETQKKRHRRTKAEIEADKQKEQESQSENSLFEELGVAEEVVEEDNRPEWEKRPAKNHDEFCEWELQKAVLEGKPDPDFDFRNEWSRGDNAFYVRISEKLGEKEIVSIFIRTVYPRTIIGTQEGACCHCIGYKDADKIFHTQHEAMLLFNSIQVINRYGEEDEYDSETGRKKRKRKKVDDIPEDDGTTEVAAYPDYYEEVKEDDEA